MKLIRGDKESQFIPIEGTSTYSKIPYCQAWWCTPLIPAHGRKRQVDLCEFKASLLYRVSSRPAGT